MAKKLKITWVRGQIATKKHHRATIRALGLHRLNETVIKESSPTILGMIRTVDFMVRVEEVE